MKAEYRALATTAAELSWLRILFKELRVFLSHVPVLWCDNVPAIALSANPVFQSRTKHLEVDYHFVREKVLRRDLCVGFVSEFLQHHHAAAAAISSSCISVLLLLYSTLIGKRRIA
uniref:Uncharacterized protein n=1 Tax=Quercus lobata TaxID=97700 RepID=A0A7N2MG60_QUELO